MNQQLVDKEVKNIFKESFVLKRSRFLKSWRERWVVLTQNYVLTFKEKQSYTAPTQVIFIKDILSVKSCDQQVEVKNAFKIQTGQIKFYFQAETTRDKQEWLGALGKAIVMGNKNI